MRASRRHLRPARGRHAQNSGAHDRRRRWAHGAAIAAVSTALVMVGVAAMVIGYRFATRPSAPAAAPSPPPTATMAPTPSTAAPPAATGAAPALGADFDRELTNTLPGQIAVVIQPVGPDHDPLVFGDLPIGKAWSTMKVPLAIAALRQEQQVTETMTAAITESDNAAAEKLWAALGDPDTAAGKVEDVLRQAGDPTRVESTKVRPPYTAFGQSDWALTDQTRFMAYAACQSGDAPILDLMARIEPDQRWGLGTITGSRFKGGWGPSPTGHYLVRQMGVLTTGTGQAAVAIAAQPASGSLSDGTRDLTAISTWLTQHLHQLPAGRCGPQ